MVRQSSGKDAQEKRLADQQVSLRMPGDLYSKLKAVADEEDRSVGYVIRVLLREALFIRDQGGLGDHDHQPFIDRN